MPQKVKKLGLNRKGKLLFVDKQGDVSQARPRRKVRKVGLKRQKGYLYFIDKQGDISRVKMKRR